MNKIMHRFCVVLDNVGSTQHCFVKLGKDCLQEIMRGIKKAKRDAVGCVFYIKSRGINEESRNHKKIKLDPSLLPEQHRQFFHLTNMTRSNMFLTCNQYLQLLGRTSLNIVIINAILIFLVIVNNLGVFELQPQLFSSSAPFFWFVDQD